MCGLGRFAGVVVLGLCAAKLFAGHDPRAQLSLHWYWASLVVELLFATLLLSGWRHRCFAVLGIMACVCAMVVVGSGVLGERCGCFGRMHLGRDVHVAVLGFVAGLLSLSLMPGVTRTSHS